MFGVAYASGKITILVNGKVIASDVAPQMVNNRVMVPISFISKALGASVGWDQKTRTVTIKGNATSQTDVWSEEIYVDSQEWAALRNNLNVFLAGYDQQDDRLIDLVVTEEFKKLKHNYIPIGGIYPAILDHKILDVKRNGDYYVVRIQVQEQSHNYEIKEAVWDIEFGEGGKINAVKVVSTKYLNSYTAFPGLTFVQEQ